MIGNQLKKLVAAVSIGCMITGISSFAAFGAAPATQKADANSAATQNNGQQGGGGRGGFGQMNTKPILDKLVKAKTITAAQETKIVAYEKKQSAARQAEMAKLQKMTQEQRQAYMQKQGSQNGNGKAGLRQSQYAELVKNKTITQKQADAIEKAIAAAMPQRGQGQNPPGGQNPQNGQNQ